MAKKYPSIQADLLALREQLAEVPQSGILIGPNVYKVRLAICCKGRGKSGGARIITYTLTSDKEVWLLAIYDKAEQEDIPDSEVNEMVSLVASIKRNQ